MSIRVKFILASVGTFLLFIFFSYIVHKNHFTQFDFDMTVRLQDHISHRFDLFFSVLSTIGRVEFMAVVLFIIWAFYRKLWGLVFFFLFGVFHLFEIYGKTFVNHLPPPHFLLRTQQIVSLPMYYVSPENSYPSGHTARAFFITTIIFLFVQKDARLSRVQKMIILIILVCYDIAMGISRVYLGEHWTSDVIGGALLGFSAAIICGVFI